MSKQTVIVVFGLPGAGKTTLITGFTEENNKYRRLSGGSLINDDLPEEERDRLRKAGADDVLINQKTLVHNFKNKKKMLSGHHILFDGHCVVKSAEGLTEIPTDVIRGLDPDIILFIDEDSETIIKRRLEDKSRPNRDKETKAELDANREKQLLVCTQYSKELGVPFKILKSPSLKDFENAIGGL